jgi:hypothetical protein
MQENTQNTHKKKKKAELKPTSDGILNVKPMEDTEGILHRNFEQPLPEPKKKKRRHHYKHMYQSQED